MAGHLLKRDLCGSFPENLVLDYANGHSVQSLHRKINVDLAKIVGSASDGFRQAVKRNEALSDLLLRRAS